ncbi:MAG: TonB-dependent receptor plug domain-containing protein [Thiovulaceae bacterium]|nr:TonB-dependent receptor plug domain-containing protein [Sulfurimonadaceae bacterium]MCW9026634.1 TonB-dependent receptor plug domain-containing protein [Sulfurimonadaceae bacterium]
MFRITLLLFLLISNIIAADLGVIEINADAQESSDKEVFTDAFGEVEYFESSEHVNSMPAQKRLSTDEAMFIPGVQGDPIKAVQSLSGVTSTSDASGEIFIYGSKPEESLTMINHLPIGYLFHMGGLHSVLSPDSIDQIDAYMAGFDATYGNAMGGVINVTPKYPDDIYHGYGHVGIYDASAGVNVPLNKNVSFYLGARRSYFDLALAAVGKSTGTLDEDTNTTYTEFPNYYDITFFMKYQHDENNLFSLELISAHDALDIYSQRNKEKDPEAVGQLKAEFGFTTLGLRHQGYYNNYETNSLFYYKHDKYRTKFYDGYFVNLTEDEYGVFHQSSYELSNHKLVVGFEARRFFLPLDFNISKVNTQENPDFDFTTATKYNKNLDIDATYTVLFLEDIYSISDNLVLKYGLRASKTTYNDMGSYIDPRVSVLYKLNDTNNLSFATGTYTQMPQGYKTVEGIGNPNSDYERAEHYLIHYDNNSFKNLNSSIDIFYKNYKDLLIDDNASIYLNNGDGYAYGLDANLKYKSDKYFAFLAYTYLRSKRETNTLNEKLYRFYGEIPHTLQLIGGMKIGDSWALSTRLNYHSGKPYTKVIGTYLDAGRVRPIYEEPFSSRLPTYFSLNIKIAQEQKLEKNSSFEWSFEIMNITNHDNISAITYDDNYNQDGVSKGLPLLPWIDLTYKF